MTERPSRGGQRRHPLLPISELFERAIAAVLLVLLLLATLMLAVQAAWTFARELIQDPQSVVDARGTTQLFGAVLTVLIGMGLFATVKTLSSKRGHHVQAVFLIAMIAAARRVILLDVKRPEGFVLLLGAAAIVLALSVGLHFVRLALGRPRDEARHPS